MRDWRRFGATALLALQAVLALRVLFRLAWTARGVRIQPASEDEEPAGDCVSVLVPVLNAADRLGPCLAGLHAQEAEVAEILVVDGGSTDDTADVVRRWSERDRRIRWVAAGPAPAAINGKVHNLARGLVESDPAAAWVLTIDADVRPQPGLVRALLDHAEATGVCVFSVATRQRLSGPAAGLVHPALLATLVYRFGIPGTATTRPAAVQANGRCMLLRREALDAAGGFAPLAGEIAEDIALARRIARLGAPVGFYDAAALVETEVYRGAADAWRNWPRSPAVRDGTAGLAWAAGLLEVTLVQALPPWLLLMPAARRTVGGKLGALNLGLVAVRVGVLAGRRRAYEQPPATYWLSPLADLPAALTLWLAAVRRRCA